MHQANVRNLMPVAQVCKPSPIALLRQHLKQQVDRVSRGQQHQEMEPPQLGRTEMSLAAAGGSVRPWFAQKTIGNKRGKLFEQGIGAGDREQRFHAQEPARQNRLRPQKSDWIVF
jgi:hypothetical protein